MTSTRRKPSDIAELREQWQDAGQVFLQRRLAAQAITRREPTLYQLIITIAFSLMMLGAATGLYVHGKKVLAISLGLAFLVYHAALQYIIHSTEAPGFTESVSLQYRVALHAMDFSIFVQLLVTLVLCWRHLTPQSKKPEIPPINA